MESLALLAAVVISLTVVGGPISLLLTFIPQRLLPLAVIKIWAFVFASVAILVGIMLMINVNSNGAMIMGVIGITTAVFAIYRVIKVIPKL
jgi:hypothetical protein